MDPEKLASFLAAPLPLTENFTLPSRAIMSPMEGLMSNALFFLTARELHAVDFWMPPFQGVSEHAVPSPGSLRKKFGIYLDSGMAFSLQILGHDPTSAARAVLHAAETGIKAVNFNFACPSKTVLGSNSGGAVLKKPHLIEKILLAAKKEVPQMCISIKMRTGFHDPEECRAILHAAGNGGCSFIICHARTVEEKYAPLSKDRIQERMTLVAENAGRIPVIGNGDITGREDAALFLSCGCSAVAAARGLLKDPLLLRKLKGEISIADGVDTRKIFLDHYRKQLSGKQGAGTYAECIKLSYGENSEEFQEAIRIFREQRKRQ